MVTTPEFINNILPQRDYMRPSASDKAVEQLEIAQSHPTAVKVMVAAAAAFAVAAIAISAAGLIGFVGIPVGILGLVLFTISVIAFKHLHLGIPPLHQMESHVFTEATCEGGRLHYQGDVPILTLDADTPRQAGWAHGFLLAKEIQKGIDAMSPLLRNIGAHNLDITDRLALRLRETLPPYLIEELDGLVEGYNVQLEAGTIHGAPLTFAKVVAVHMVPDSLHFNLATAMAEEDEPSRELNWWERLIARFAKPAPTVGCTVLVGGNRNMGPIFARNMDWPSFGCLGALSLVFNRVNRETGASTLEVGVPGLVGTITGMKSTPAGQRLALAMNVCKGTTHSLEGIPAAFYNRMCLDQCDSVADVEQFVEDHNPLGPYHLNVADNAVEGSRATAFHLHEHREQEGDDSHHRREWDGYSTLVTTNCRYHPERRWSNLGMSEARHSVIDHYLQDARETINPNLYNTRQVLNRALALPKVNNPLTVHKVMMEPQTGRFGVAVANMLGGNRRLRELNI